MPKGPQGQKRPADVIGAAVKVMRIATGEEEEAGSLTDPAAVERGRSGGKKGGAARAGKLTKKRRVAIARKAAAARWGSDKG